MTTDFWSVDANSEEYSTLFPPNSDGGICGLYFGILWQAVDDIRNTRQGQEAERWRKQAQAWVRSPDRHSLTSFVSVCGICGLDHVAVRRALLTEPPPSKQPLFAPELPVERLLGRKLG